MPKIYLYALVFTMGSLIGCGSDSDSAPDTSNTGYGVDYEGKTTALQVQPNDAAAIGASVHKAVSEFLSGNQVTTSSRTLMEPKIVSVESAAGSLKTVMTEYSNVIKSYVGTDPIPNQSIDGECGGSATAKGDYLGFELVLVDYCTESFRTLANANGTASYYSNPESADLSLMFDQFSIDFDSVELAVDGKITSEKNEEGIETLHMYANTKIEALEKSINFTQSCAPQAGCPMDLVVAASDGHIYQVKQFDLDLESDAWNGQGVLYLPADGHIELSFSNLTYCDDGDISTAEIVVTDEANESITLSYSQCGIDPAIRYISASDK